MKHRLAQRFMQALQLAEEKHDAAPVANLFSDDAELSKLTHEQPHRGGDGARRFWDEYLGAFKQIRSQFHRIIEADGAAVLEWTSEGELPNGEPIAYRGVSIVEGDGEQVRRFRTYYDSAAFVGVGSKQ